MANTQTTLSSQIYSSRDQIRNQIIEYARKYLELENVELVKGSFLSFLVETLSTLTSNLIFYESSTYKEFFLTKAQIPESVFNLSAFLGYNTVEASYATANAMVTIPLDFNNSPITINIPEGFQFYAKTIPFTTYYDTEIVITNNNQVSITVTEGNKILNLPYIIDTTSNNNFIFVLPVRQYETITQQFQIDEDLQPFQFSYIDVPLTGKVSTMTVSVTDPNGIASTIYTEYNSLYLMSADDYGYVSRRTDFGRRIYFGNGLIGVQPTPGSTVTVAVQQTLGNDGNVIGGSIATGDNLYTLDGLINKNISYTVINPVAATGGEDEESVEEIRKNSIDNLTSLHRLVSQNDYVNANIVIPDSPITANSLPVLKRSDLRVNEIQLYTNLIFGTNTTETENLVPTRNAYYSYPSGTTYVPRLSTVTIDGIDYYTMFDMRIDLVYNSVAYYTYIMNEISQTPALVRSFNLLTPYILTANNLVVNKSGSSAVFELSYNSTEVDYDMAECTMQILSTGSTYTMTNDYLNKKFTYTFTNYTDVPEDEQTFYFTLINPSSQSIAIYSNIFTYRKPLDSFMMSNLSSDGTNVIVYDIPVIQQSYYDNIDQPSFELQVLQSMLTNMDFINYRMLTDFVNLKFTNTTGKSRAMLLNDTTKLPVIDISALPTADYVYLWSTSSSLNVPRTGGAACGDTNDALSFGGYSPTNTTEIWSGTAWATTSNLNQGRVALAGCGVANCALSFGGNVIFPTQTTEIWDGSTWATTSIMTSTRYAPAGCGTVTDALVFGGATTGVGTSTEIWSGTFWSLTGALNQPRFWLAGCGTTASALSFGGNSTITSAITEKWNGTAWATTSTLNTARYALAGGGNTSSAISFGGTNPYTTTEIWNGSTWATTSALNYERYAVAGCGSTLGALAIGGDDSHAITNAVTEKWNSVDISGISLGDRYIVAECDTANSAYKNQIAQCIDATNVTWTYTVPVSNDMVYVTDKGMNYLYTGKDWFAPIYDIPLVISLEIFKEDTYSGSEIDLTNSIRSGIVEEFSSRFGSNSQIYRSEIIKYVQGLDGVSYCTLIEPKSDIYFNFDLADLTQDELLRYSPEYIYFNEDSIEIRIL